MPLLALFAVWSLLYLWKNLRHLWNLLLFMAIGFVEMWTQCVKENSGNSSGGFGRCDRLVMERERKKKVRSNRAFKAVLRHQRRGTLCPSPETLNTSANGTTSLTTSNSHTVATFSVAPTVLAGPSVRVAIGGFHWSRGQTRDDDGHRYEQSNQTKHTVLHFQSIMVGTLEQLRSKCKLGQLLLILEFSLASFPEPLLYCSGGGDQSFCLWLRFTSCCCNGFVSVKSVANWSTTTGYFCLFFHT